MCGHWCPIELNYNGTHRGEIGALKTKWDSDPKTIFYTQMRNNFKDFLTWLLLKLLAPPYAHKYFNIGH